MKEFMWKREKKVEKDEGAKQGREERKKNSMDRQSEKKGERKQTDRER